MEKVKFDLKTRKLLNNSNINVKDLPGFEDGTAPTQYEPLWNNVWNKSFLTSDGLYTSNAPVPLNNLPQAPYQTGGRMQTVEGVSPVLVNNQIALLKLGIDTTKELSLPKLNTINSNNSSNTNAGMQALASSNPWVAAAMAAVGGAIDGLNAHPKTNQIMYEAGLSTGNVGGIEYTKYNLTDAAKRLHEYDKKAVEKGILNPAEGIAMAFGRDDYRQQIAQANVNARNITGFNYSVGATQAYKQNRLDKQGDFSGLVLHAKNGKLPGFANGLLARLSNGEVYGHINPITGYVSDVHQAGHGKDNKDTLVRNLGNPETSFVITNKGGWSDYVRDGGSIQNALIGMLSGTKAPGYKCGKLPKLKEGWWGNAAVSGIGALASLGLIWDASRLDIVSPNIYASNPYEYSALNDLAGLRINEYPIINKLNQLRAESDYAIDNSGGLGAGLRARVRAANLATTQRGIADALINIQSQNNQYRSQLANAKMSLGAQRAQRMQAANQYRADMTARAHAAKQQGIQAGLSNLLAQIQGYYSNDSKRRQFNETMDLYRQWLKLDEARFKADQDRYNNPTTSISVPQSNKAYMKSYLIPQLMQDAFWWTQGINMPMFRNALMLSNGINPYKTK